MRKVYLFDMGLLVLAGTVAAVLADDPVQPAKPSKDNIAGAALDRQDMREHPENGNMTIDVTLLESGDKSFPSGNYESRSIRFEVAEPRGNE